MTEAPRILWADLHNHNEIGYGRGSLDRSYRVAENTLDVYALTVHGHWPDPPANDPALARYHAEGLARVAAAFPEVVREANRRYQPGRFVTFIGYEWHSIAAGDYVVLFPGETGELFCAPDVGALQAFVRAQGAIMIPHHVAYQLGWRGLDWRRLDHAVSPLVEIFSEHGSGWDRDDSWPMLAHSMGGGTFSQGVRTQLAAGAHFGFTAGTDTHFGYPGSHGEGITGIYAAAATRHDVFAALRQRRTLAATGDRIELRVASHGAQPGDALPAGAPREFAIKVAPLAPLDYLEVIKNGARVHLWPVSEDVRRDQPPAASCLTRLEWGWGRLEAAEETDWRITVTVADGEIRRVIPCLGAGAGSVEKLNLIYRIDHRSVRVESFTSRRNPFPVNGIVLEIAGAPSAQIDCSVEAAVGNESGGCTLRATLRALGADDVWGAVLPRFSSPRIRLGRARATAELAFATTFRDAQPGPRDTYVFKARQTNGHTAWTSPFLFAGDV